MDEDTLMALVGRLYVGTVLRDNELRRLRGLVDQYEARALTPDDQQENPNGTTPEPS